MLYEDFCAHLRFVDGGAEAGGYSYEDARYCSAIFRDGLSVVAQPNCTYVLLAAMFGSVGEGSRTLWEDLWQQHGMRDGREWFERYVCIALRAQLALFLRYGIAIEAHQQNVYLEFGTTDGELRRIIYQELGGGIYWDAERIAQLSSIDFRAEVYSRDDIMEPCAKCLAVVHNTMLRMHLLPLSQIVAKHFGLRADELTALVNDLVRTTPAQPWASQDLSCDQMAPNEFSRYATEAIEGLLGAKRDVKALLRMRLFQTKSEMYVSPHGAG